MFLPFLPGFPASSQLLSSPWFLPGLFRVSSTSRDHLWLPPEYLRTRFQFPHLLFPRTIQPLLVHHLHPLHTRTLIISCVFSCPIPRKIPSNFWRAFVLFIRDSFPCFCLSFIKSPFGLISPCIFVLVCLGLPTGPPPVLGPNSKGRGQVDLVWW